jgi:hypothetical protein
MELTISGTGTAANCHWIGASGSFGVFPLRAKMPIINMLDAVIRGEKWLAPALL